MRGAFGHVRCTVGSHHGRTSGAHLPEHQPRVRTLRTPLTCLRFRSSARSTPGYRTQPSPRSRNGSPASRAAIGAVAASSGQAAELFALSAFCEAGDHIVASPQLYGGTRTLMEGTLDRFGVTTTFVTGNDPGAYAAAVHPNTKVVYTEVVANPSGAVADLEGLAVVAHGAGGPLVVDGTIATP